MEENYKQFHSIDDLEAMGYFPVTDGDREAIEDNLDEGEKVVFGIDSLRVYVVTHNAHNTLIMKQLAELEEI